MAAGLGFKTFTTGEVLTAADVNGYLMQGILVFANAAARTSAITSPQEGQYSFLKDTNALEYYDGAAWVGAPVGDITSVTAGTGISGGGSSGDVTITNSMATAIDAKGDLIAGTADNTFSRLAVGNSGETLVADSSTTTGLKWATPNGYTELATGSLTSGTTISLTTISGAYLDLQLWLYNVDLSTAGTLSLTLNNDTATKYRYMNTFGTSTQGAADATNIFLTAGNIQNGDLTAFIRIPMYSQSTSKMVLNNLIAIPSSDSTSRMVTNAPFGYYSSDAITRIDVTATQTFSSGTYKLYGVK